MIQISVDILLVEDNINDAELAIRELKKHKMTDNLVHVSDGEEALEFIFATGKHHGIRNIDSPPKLVLLDIQMPKVNGIEVLQQIKSDPRTKKIPVVILTSSKENPDIQKCYDLGANSYIVKPVDSNNFFNAIKEIGLYWMVFSEPSH